jgi:hypothetical protein
MLRLLVLLTGIVLVSQFPCRLAVSTSAGEPTLMAGAGQQTTELMKQSDYHKRVANQRRTKDVDERADAIESGRAESRLMDNVVLIMLILSAVGFFIFSKALGRKASGRRRAGRLSRP